MALARELGVAGLDLWAPPMAPSDDPTEDGGVSNPTLVVDEEEDEDDELVTTLGLIPRLLDMTGLGGSMDMGVGGWGWGMRRPEGAPKRRLGAGGEQEEDGSEEEEKSPGSRSHLRLTPMPRPPMRSWLARMAIGLWLRRVVNVLRVGDGDGDGEKETLLIGGWAAKRAPRVGDGS
jgi:hypothetical protein